MYDDDETPNIRETCNKDGADWKLKVRNEVFPLSRCLDLARLFFQSHHNFKESGTLLNLKMYKNGPWMDFATHAIVVLI